MGPDNTKSTLELGATNSTETTKTNGLSFKLIALHQLTATGKKTSYKLLPLSSLGIEAMSMGQRRFPNKKYEL